MSDMHVTGECLDDAAKFVLKRLLMNYFMRQAICPACLEELLRELAADCGELWSELNSDKHVCTYKH